jgi:hypothetical protein
LAGGVIFCYTGSTYKNKIQFFRKIAFSAPSWITLYESRLKVGIKVFAKLIDFGNFSC